MVSRSYGHDTGAIAPETPARTIYVRVGTLRPVLLVDSQLSRFYDDNRESFVCRRYPIQEVLGLANNHHVDAGSSLVFPDPRPLDACERD